VSGLQHFHWLLLPFFGQRNAKWPRRDVFRVRSYAGMSPHADLTPFSMPPGERGLVRSPVPLFESLSTGPGTVDIAGPGAGLRRYMKGDNGGTPAKTSPRRGTAPGTPITCQQCVGISEATLFAQGFNRRMLASLIRAGLATAQPETIKAGSQSLGRSRGRVMITEAGRRALECVTDHRPSPRLQSDE
jgi:hypothetical protein